PISLILIFKGRIQLGKIRKIFCLICHQFLCLKPWILYLHLLVHLVPKSPSEPMSEPTPRLESMPETTNEPQEKTHFAPRNLRFDKVFTRRKMAILEPM